MLSPEEIDAIQISQDDRDELEEMATIGLTNCEEDHEEYAKRVPYLLEQRLKERVAKAQEAQTLQPVMREAFKKIIGCFTRNVIHTERQRSDNLLSSIQWSNEIFKHEEWIESQILPLIASKVQEATHIQDAKWRDKLIDAGIPVMDPDDIPETLHTEAYLNEAVKQERERIKADLERLGVLAHKTGKGCSDCIDTYDCIHLQIETKWWNKIWQALQKEG